MAYEKKDIKLKAKAFNCPSCCELLEEREESLYFCSRCKIYFLILELSVKEGKKLCDTLDHYLRRESK